MKFTITIIGIGILLISLSGCRKDRDDDVIVPPKPVLSVKLSQDYVTAALVDSAIAVWTVNNTPQRIKMTLSNDSLLADMDKFNEGNGELTITIFTHKKYRNQYLGHWVNTRTTSLQKTRSLHLTGPGAFNDMPWKPRVELKDGTGHFAIIALRPDDPYFFVKTPAHPVIEYLVDRSYWKIVGGVDYAGGKTWECRNNCGNVENTDYFTDLPARIGTRQWNHISIYVFFQTDNIGGGPAINLEIDVE